MQQSKHVTALLITLLVLSASGSPSSAQNMSGTVVERRVQFARGKQSAVLRGKAAYAKSYVYRVRAQKDQEMSVELKSGQSGPVTFSLIAPDTATIEKAFSVKQWSGKLPQSGDYSIVVVMNEKSIAPVEYVLTVAIR